MKKRERLRRKNEFDGELLMGARRFNIKTMRKTHLNKIKIKKIFTKLINPDTGLLRKRYSLRRSCPVCGKTKERPIFVKDGFSHIKCASCAMVYVNPVLKKSIQRDFYREEDSYTSVLRNKLNISMDRKRFRYALDILEEYLPSKGKLLDIGCGPGTFLQLARKRKWQVTGIEYNKKCVRKLKKMNIDVIDIPFEHSNFPGSSFQCVTMWAVLEHIVDPKAFLKAVRKILVPGGMLVLLVPNVDGLANRILREKSTTFAGYSHINLFNNDTLERLLKKARFESIDSETIVTLSGTINNYLNYESAQLGNGKPVLDFLTPRYIHDRKLGYALVVFARARKR
ncbi:class I SAM-dependent methyltransferase [Candidatus Omnitrophota bacterium]